MPDIFDTLTADEPSSDTFDRVASHGDVFDRVASAPAQRGGDVFDRLAPDLPDLNGPRFRAPRDSMELGAQNFYGEQQLAPMLAKMEGTPEALKPGPEGIESVLQSVRQSKPVETLLGPARLTSPNAPGSDIEKRGLLPTAAGLPSRITTDLGRGLKAGLGDIAAGAAGSDEFGGNVKEFLAHDKKLPVERALELSKEEDKERHALGWQTIAADISLGLADMAPKVAMLEAVPGGTAIKAGAAADIFGFSDKGEFEPRSAAFAAAFPFATSAASSAADAAIQKAVDRGFEWAGSPAGQRALHVAANQAAMDGLMIVQQSPELLKLSQTDPDEFKRQLAKIMGSNLAFAIPEALKAREAVAPEAEKEPVKVDLKDLQAAMRANQIPGGTTPQEAASAWGQAEERYRDALIKSKPDAAQAEQDAIEARLDFEASAERAKISDEEKQRLTDMATETRPAAAEVQPNDAELQPGNAELQPATVAEKEAAARNILLTLARTDDAGGEVGLTIDHYVENGTLTPEEGRSIEQRIKSGRVRSELSPEEFLHLLKEPEPARTEAAAAPETSTVRTATVDQGRTDERKGSEMTAETGEIPARAAAAAPAGAIREGETAPAATPTQTPKRRKPTQAEQTRPWDLIDEIEGGHGMISLNSARTIQEDFKPIGAARKLFSARRGGRAEAVDVITEDLRRRGVFPEDATEQDLLDGLNAAATARKGWRKGVTGEQKDLQNQERQHVEFSEDIKKKSQKTETLVPEDLNEGDQFTLRGAKLKVTRLEFDEDGRVTSLELDDGQKYGTQQVDAGTALRMDKGSLKKAPEKEVNFAEGTEGEPGEVPTRAAAAISEDLQDARELEAKLRDRADQLRQVGHIQDAERLERKRADAQQRIAALEAAESKLNEPGKDAFEQLIDQAIEKTSFKRGEALEGVSGAPVWMTKALVNGALHVIRASYKAGKKIYHAIEEGVRWLREQNAEGFNEEEARHWLNELARKEGIPEEPRHPGMAGWEIVRDKLTNISRRVSELKQQIEQNEQQGRPVKDLKQELRFAQRQHKALFEALQNDPERIEDLILRHDQAAKDLAAARKRGQVDDIQRKRAALESLAGWLESLPQRKTAEIYRRLHQEGRISAPESVHEDEAWTEAASAAGERAASPINSLNPDAVRARPNDAPEPGKPWDESVPGVSWIPAALDGLRLLRARIAAWWRGRGTREEMSYTFDAADNRANAFAKRVSNTVLHALNRAFGVKASDVSKRNELREIALSFVVEAKGDQAALNEMREKILAGEPHKQDGRRALKAISFAEAHLDILQPVADLYARLTEMERGHELNAGLDVPAWKRTGYVYHAQDLDVDAILTRSGKGGAGILSQPHTHVRDYATLADSIAAGIHPHSMNAIDLLMRRVQQGQRAVNQTAWLQSMREMKDPTTSQPLVTDLQVRTRPDGSEDVTAPAGYSRMQFGPLDVALLNGYDGIFGDLANPSWVRSGPIGRTVVKTAQVLKSVTLLFDTFHLGRLAFWKLVVTHDPFYKKGLTLLDNTPGELRLMAENGEIPKEWLGGLEESKRRLELAAQTGFNIGRIADNMHTDWLHNLPGIGTFNKWLFQQYQRGAMADSWLMEFERMKKALPDAPEQVIARRVSRDLNTRFGNLGRQGFFRSQTGQDLARIFLLAPQWNEALIRSELGFAKQLVTAPIESAKQGRIVVPTLLRAVGTMLLGQFIANQFINYATRHKPTWENEEEGWGAKLSAWIPDFIGHGPGFFLHPFGIAAEIAHLLAKKFERTGDVGEAIREAARSRLSNFGQGSATWLMKREQLGRTLRPDEVWAATAKALVPLPISGSAIFAAARQAVTGEHSEQFAGQFQKQLMSTVGIKTDQAPSSEQRVQALAREFNRNKGIAQNAEFYHGDYKDLESALRLGNSTDARRAMEDLLTKKTPAEIYRHWQAWARAPFTGKVERENEFRRTLTANQLDAYQAAREAREKLRNEALQLLR